jgi:hypothetical protein
LEAAFNKYVIPLFDHGQVKDLSVFAFAPQALLIKLGTLLSDSGGIAFADNVARLPGKTCI